VPPLTVTAEFPLLRVIAVPKLSSADTMPPLTVTAESLKITRNKKRQIEKLLKSFSAVIPSAVYECLIM